MGDSFPVRKIRDRRTVFYRAQGWRLALVAGAFAGVSGLVWVVQPSWSVPAWTLPLVIAAFGWGVAQSSLDGTYYLEMAAEAEKWTKQELKKLGDRGWNHVNSISFDYCDIDHVVVCPAGVYVIETKHTDSDLDLDDLPPWTDGWMDQTRRGTRKIDLLLNYQDRIGVPVRSVVAVWGTAVTGGPVIRDDVLIVKGKYLGSLLARQEEDNLSGNKIDSTIVALEGFKLQRYLYARGQLSRWRRLVTAYSNLVG